MLVHIWSFTAVTLSGVFLAIITHQGVFEGHHKTFYICYEFVMVMIFVAEVPFIWIINNVLDQGLNKQKQLKELEEKKLRALQDTEHENQSSLNGETNAHRSPEADQSPDHDQEPYEMSDGNRNSLISGVSYPMQQDNDEDEAPNPDFPNFQQWQRKTKMLRSHSMSSVDSSENTKAGSRTNSFDDIIKIIRTHNRQNDPGVNFSEVAGCVTDTLVSERPMLGGLENNILGNIMQR